MRSVVDKGRYKMLRSRLLLMLALSIGALTLLDACASQIVSVTEHANSWVGRSIDDYKHMRTRSRTYADQIGWEEKEYKFPNGNSAYVVPVRLDCYIHWEVNTARTIVAYKTEGARCY